MVHVFGKCRSTIFFASLMGLLAAAFAVSIGGCPKRAQDHSRCQSMLVLSV